METVFGLYWIAVIVGAYFAPALLAYVLHRRFWIAIAVVDLFFAWTVVGWIVALALACADLGRVEVKPSSEHPAA